MPHTRRALLDTAQWATKHCTDCIPASASGRVEPGQARPSTTVRDYAGAAGRGESAPASPEVTVVPPDLYDAPASLPVDLRCVGPNTNQERGRLGLPEFGPTHRVTAGNTAGNPSPRPTPIAPSPAPTTPKPSKASKASRKRMPPSVAPLTASIPPEIPGHVIDVLTLIATPCRDSASAAVPTETDPRVSAAARAQALAGGVTLADITLGPALCRRAGRPATPATLEQIEGADGLRWRITADADAGETLAGLNARRKGYATRKNMEAKVFSALGMAPQAFVLACRALVEEVQRASSAEVAAWAVDPADDDALRTLVARAAARLAEDVGLVALYRYHLAAAAVVAGESRGEETAAQCTAASA